jgi:hypothetical protein
MRFRQGKKTRALNKRRRKFLELDNSINEEPTPYSPTGETIELDIDLIKKKIHKEDEERSIQSTDDSSVGHRKQSSMYLDPHDSINEEPFLERVVEKIEPINRRTDGKGEQSLDFLWEDSLGPVWEIDDIGQEYVPKKIRNFGLENSINPIFWEYEYQNNSNFDLM